MLLYIAGVQVQVIANVDRPLAHLPVFAEHFYVAVAFRGVQAGVGKIGLAVEFFYQRRDAALHLFLDASGAAFRVADNNRPDPGHGAFGLSPDGRQVAGKIAAVKGDMGVFMVANGVVLTTAAAVAAVYMNQEIRIPDAKIV